MTIRYREQGMYRDSQTLSSGLADILGVCVRVAIVDSMYQDEKPMLIMDDPFVNLDDSQQCREETSDRLHSSGQRSIQKCLLLAHALANKRHGHNCTFREVLYSDSYGKCKCTCDGHAHIAHGCACVHNAHCHALGDIVERDCKYHHGRLLKL